MNPALFPARKKPRWYWGFISALFAACIAWLTLDPLYVGLCLILLIVIVEPVVEGDDMS